MFAHIQLHTWMQRQHDQLTGGVTREGDAAWSMGNADDEGHAGQRALDTALQRHYRHGRVIIFPKHHMMLEEDGIALAQIDFGHRHDLAFNLASAHAEMNLSHVANARRLAPARLAYQIAHIQRRAARAARKRALLVLRGAPFANDTLKRFRGRGRVGYTRRVGLNWSIRWRTRSCCRGGVTSEFRAVNPTESFLIVVRPIALG